MKPKLLIPFILLLTAMQVLAAGNAGKQIVVVLSLDGFRWDYPSRYHTPNLDRLARKGCKAISLVPSYPTKTFPNHYSIATGLYPDHHGIVQNGFYDPRLDRSFKMGDRKAVEDSIFWEGEAIWETAEKQGVRAASYFWVGSETNERYRPSYRKIYESGFPYTQQIDTVMRWLSLPDKDRPSLVMFYFDEPDMTSHSFGPVSRETGKVVRRLDKLVGTVYDRLMAVAESSGLSVDLIVLSDHGMGAVPDGNTEYLGDYIDLKRIRRINGGNPVFVLDPEPEYLNEALEGLRKAPHLKAWPKSELPGHYRYGTHHRIQELIVEADSAWGVEVRQRAEGRRQKESEKDKVKSVKEENRGMHGYDPANRDMHGIFYAVGPSFRTGFVQPSFENVNIYSLLARLLNITPVKTDGSLEAVSGMLKDH